MNIKELAKISGFSVATISRVINNLPGVKPFVREKIEKLIKETGYTPNLVARALIRKKTNLIGIILPAIDTFFSYRINAITDFFNDNNYSIMIANSQIDPDIELKNIKLLLEKQVDGIIFFGLRIKDYSILKEISDKVKIVIADTTLPELLFPTIIQNDYESSLLIMKHLIENGHKKIGFIKGHNDLSTAERFRAYTDTLARNNIPMKEEYVKTGSYSTRLGYNAALDLLELNDRPTAIFAANDNMAIGSLKAAGKMGLRVPDDLSVAGYDDIQYAFYTSPSLTTVRQDQKATGLTIAKTMLKSLTTKDYKPETIKLSQELIIRESTGKAK